MRRRMIGFAVLVPLALCAAAMAATPMLLLLDRASGRGSISLSTGTAQLHRAVWLYLARDSQPAHGKATVTCTTNQPEGSSGSIQWFRFQIRAGARQEVWRHTDVACTIAVTLSGRGRLSGSLRGS